MCALKFLNRLSIRKNMKNTFDTNLLFKIMGISYGEWDFKNGMKKEGLKSLWLRFYSSVWFSIFVLNVIRYSILLCWPRYTKLEFYLCDYAQLMSGKSYRWMMSCGPFFNVWVLICMVLFRKLNYSKKDSFWLKFLQIPKTRSPDELNIDGFSSENLKEYWRKCSNLLHFLKLLALMGFFTMSLGCMNYIYASKIKYYDLYEPKIFWTIAVANYCSLLFVGIFDFVFTFGLIVYLYLISRFLKERFDLIETRLSRLAYKGGQLNLAIVDKLIHQFNLVQIDLLKCNYFWRKFNFWNYYFGILLCSVLLLICILFLFVFVPVILTSFYVCGELHNSIKKNHRPLMKILERKELTKIEVIRILRILDWIHSEHSGFNCLDLFPMRKGAIVEVFFSIIAQSILIYDLTFNIFYQNF